MSDLPTVDNLLGARPTPEQLLGLKAPEGNWTFDGQFMDEQFGQGSNPGYILDVFGQGVKRGWGTKPLGLPENTIKELKDNGVFNDYEKSHNSWVKQFNETLLRSTAAAADFAMRGPVALYYGLGDVAEKMGVPKDIVGLPEAFPAGRGTGFPHSVPLLEKAADLDVIPGKTAENVAREAFAPATEIREVERPVEVTTPEGRATEPEAAPAQPADIHITARMIAPDTFAEYDALAERKDVFKRWIDELQEVRRNDPRVVEAQAEIDRTLERVRGVEERLTKRAASRLEENRQAIDDFLANDTPDMARVRRDLLETDYKMRDLAPDVSEAYREAQRQMPAEEAPITTPAESAPTPIAEPALQDQVAQQAQTIENLSQRRATIAREIERRLVEAGRPADEARAAAALVQTHYEARAARFNGALGTARDLYTADDPTITREIGGSRRGSFNIARNQIRLFRDSDASTFIHETGHQWLEELRRDSEHPAAPQDLHDDIQTVRDWLGAEGAFTRAQHEKFARGFERYMMEGQAPTSKLASVFEKFKNWLTQIYQTVSRLRAPITDDIRGVYDRLLSTPNKEPVIVPEREGAVDFATAAETAAREVPPDQALDAADRVRDERERVAEILSKVVDDARRNARRGSSRVVIPEREGAGGERATTGAGAGQADVTLDTGRNPPQGKSAAPTSAVEPFVASDGDLVDKAGNIRVDNLNVSEDVGAAIKTAAQEGAGFTAARRGMLTDAEVYNLADDLGMSAEKLDRRKIGEAFNAEEIVAARKLLIDSATQVRDAMGRAAVGDEQGLIDYAIARERHLMIQEQVAGVTAEAGRALRAFKNMEGLKEAGMLADLFQKNLGKTPEQLQREAQMGLRLDTPQKLSKFVRDQSAPGWKDMVIEAWINSLLSGPYTHVRNMVGNATVAANSVVETAGAAAVSALRRSDAVRFAEVKDRVEGLLQGAQEGVVAFGHALRDESVAFDETSRPTERTRRAIPDVNVFGVNVPLGQAIRLPGRFLAAEDEFFKAIAFRQELNVLARRSARLEGLEGGDLEARTAELLRDPTEEMLAGATKHAQYQTFTNQLGPVGRALTQFADSHVAVRFILPFIRTPTNILKYALERTPFGLASVKVRDNLMGRNGEVAKDTQIARLALGTGLMTAVGGLALNGLVTGGGPYRPEEIAVKRATGWQPYSWRIGDTHFSYSGLDPISIPVGLATDFVDLAKAGVASDKEMSKLGAMLVTAVSRDVLNKLSFRGAAGLIQAITEPENYGPKFINQMVGSVVPAALAQGAQMDDPVAREARTLLDTLRSRIPFMRENLPPRRDVFGEPIPQTDLGPIQTSTASNDPTRLTLDKLGLTLAAPQRKIGGVELTPQQYDDYTRISGRFAKAQLDHLLEMPAFTNIPDGIKKKIIHNVFEKSRKLGRTQVMMGSIGSDNDLVKKGVEEKLKVLK